jgi:hypothetical protein
LQRNWCLLLLLLLLLAWLLLLLVLLLAWLLLLLVAQLLLKRGPHPQQLHMVRRLVGGVQEAAPGKRNHGPTLPCCTCCSTVEEGGQRPVLRHAA